MTLLDSLGLVGEIISWVGLGIGLPLLLAAALIRADSGRWEPTEIAVIRSGDALSARWFADGDFRERPLRAAEADVDEGWHAGYVSSRRPDRARFAEPPAAGRVCGLLGGVLAGSGAVGFVVSWLPVMLSGVENPGA